MDCLKLFHQHARNHPFSPYDIIRAKIPVGQSHVYACVCTIQNHVSEGHVSVKYALEHARCLEGINPSTRRS